MKRFNWDEMKTYWQVHHATRAKVDLTSDPDSLDNVCHTGAPLWLNRYYAKFQRQVYEQLLGLVPLPAAGARAIDVGCGGGRWCRLLAAHGFQVTGLDLQKDLVESNQKRHPEMRFVCTSIQEFDDVEKFDLISSVTVIQHNPFDEQDRILSKFHSLLKPSGYALILENVSDQAPHVFANSIRGWQEKFSRAGFRCLAVQRYDYNPMLQLQSFLSSRLLGEAKPSNPKGFMNPDRSEAITRSALRAVKQGVRAVSLGVDSLIEPFLVRTNLPVKTVHCGFLFQK